ncbi:hypothetical protein [Ureibacillus chungkukjangi]|uniref:hypothetical protein n=1 Tax=Ureibacillus chungkukjangi TaxID=1202712 RepID=UPI000D39D10A|nr:hypothetical protein [Ureibacillus chungkukjangi]
MKIEGNGFKLPYNTDMDRKNIQEDKDLKKVEQRQKQQMEEKKELDVIATKKAEAEQSKLAGQKVVQDKEEEKLRKRQNKLDEFY